MALPPRPEVLAAEWVPPFAESRVAAVEEAQAALRVAASARDVSPLAVAGPPGSGTSTVLRIAARFARGCGDARSQREWSRILAVRTRFLPSTREVAGELVRTLDAGFTARGFSVTELMAGFLRRAARYDRSPVVLLDDVAAAGPDLSTIVQALASPDRFLPEGWSASFRPKVGMAGTPEGLDRLASRFVHFKTVKLPAYSRAELRRIAVDRLRRALDRAPDGDSVERLVAAALSEGGGAARLLQLLRREVLGPESDGPSSPFAPHGLPPTLSVEPRMVRALERAAVGRTALMCEIRRQETILARSEGRRPLPATTFWRRIVRLEAAGLVRRTVRTGGAGGTRSLVEIVRPVREWPPVSSAQETRLGAGQFAAERLGESALLAGFG